MLKLVMALVEMRSAVTPRCVVILLESISTSSASCGDRTEAYCVNYILHIAKLRANRLSLLVNSMQHVLYVMRLMLQGLHYIQQVPQHVPHKLHYEPQGLHDVPHSLQDLLQGVHYVLHNV
jgi:hypothetical protein